MAPSIAAHLMRTESISRADTPEPSARQGRRNDSSQGGVQLLDSDGGLSERFEACLAHIFAKYIEPPFIADRAEGGLMKPPKDAYLTDSGLDRYATETNGQPFTTETKDELKEMIDCDDQGRLTLEGFFQIYQLQTENDEEETWKDLSTHGFGRDLNLVSSRREDEDEPVTSTTATTST
ncbi:hypothetical protein M407DRAFT_245828 [Tulasnella calospora MUT 4182]|uniref:EF-hand domain-containing protein n=1 Tax=Tulasnella calospora MUT 4182 TaxID=1051891 RepID=A0A0C3Q855_9AGAM|nr:hypothetical protein M407DRAFT_245828 [Tulasnella calospora MUT 4182]